jgi:hypothetical protein
MKLQFLETSYFIMLSAYAAAVVSLTLILIVWGAEGDGYTSVLTVLGKRTLVIYWLFLPVLLIIDLFFSWLGLHGYRSFFEDSTYRADMIVTSNGSIAEIVLILSLSLLCSLAIARFTVCYLHARRHAPDIPEQLPTRSIPPQDPRPEVEYWKPEDRER